MNLWQRWKKVSINNQLMIYMTAILAVATTLYTLMYRSSVKFAEQSARQQSEQTDRLIAASERLAASTKEALDETKRVNRESADRAERALKAAEEEANASAIQSETSRTSARAAEASAKIAAQSFNIGERPYIATRAIEANNFAAGQRPTITIQFDNSGKTPALNSRVRSYSAIRAEKKLGAVTYPAVPSLSTSIVQSGCCHKQIIPAFAVDLPQEAINALIEAIKQRQVWFFVYGIADYDDGAGKRHTLLFCQYYNADLDGLFSYCGEHNSSN